MAASNPIDPGVEQFLNALQDEQKRKDSLTLIGLVKEVTGVEAKMWGTSIIGFGTYHYKYASGREGDGILAGFSPRKQALTLYNMRCIDANTDLRAKLGKHKIEGGCLHIKRLSDVDLSALKNALELSYAHMIQETDKKTDD